jgi:hypothetical protein
MREKCVSKHLVALKIYFQYQSLTKCDRAAAELAFETGQTMLSGKAN